MSNGLNGSGKRLCTSWIDQFVEHTDNLESAPIFRRWGAISAIAAVLEQKVWVNTQGRLYPNLYTFLIGNAGIGKSRVIHAATGFIRELPQMYFGATSMTMAFMVDMMNESKRQIINMPEPMIEYNTLYIVADELSAFMHKYEDELIAGLTTFYDCGEYSQGRRVKDIRIKIKRPQLNVLTGSTPSNLLQLVPDWAWGQGFMSRVMLIYAEERPMINIFETPHRPMPEEMIHDLKIINALNGQIGWTDEYARASHNWKLLDFTPKPKHPRLEHYSSRRNAHLLKLSMVACVDRGNDLTLTVADFNRAMGWLLEAEERMSIIFSVGSSSIDSKAMDEILHFINQAGAAGISEHRIVNFARTRVQYANNIMSVLTIMEQSKMIVPIDVDKKTGLRIFAAG